ncbi:Uncharacterized iron-regulated protein [Pseudobacteriovorax antillogorgiicola]|uniref:Uncharacterized iron-regulated protein n=2 Tax=Pseudobacteriovorax antillogorgiicola TaxID=1513793 RepID=A0A1Y6B7Y9_9BACT|nr:putative iron-regulated protein [Pseudobacteriovorax antillogorgiicola]SME95877.1 Uncharacterized iron-regulated protein [Pseudobacteriovorax antillogorgiicola]
MYFIAPIFALLLVLMSACQHSSLSQGEDIERLLKEALLTDVVILGEKHDNPEHHRIQAQFIKELSRQGRLQGVYMEHLFPSQEMILVKESAEVWPEKLNWKTSGWPSYSVFQSLFDVIAAEKPPVYGVGIPRHQLKAFYKKQDPGYLNEDEKKSVGLTVPLPDQAHQDLLRTIVKAHCGYLDEKSAGFMMPLQRYKDAFMAKRYFEHRQAGKVAVYIIGAGHGRRDFGVPYYLKYRDPKLRILSIQLQERGQGLGQEPNFDRILVTEAVDHEDPCMKFKKSLEKSFKKGAKPKSPLQHKSHDGLGKSHGKTPRQ